MLLLIERRIGSFELTLVGTFCAPKALNFGGSNTECVWYQPTSPGAVSQGLAALRIPFSDFTFVDFGCGKGRVLLIASQFPFRQVLGVEFSTQLVEIARQNAARFRTLGLSKCPVNIVCQNAASFVPPASPLVVWMFTPFKGEMLRSVLRNLVAHVNKGWPVLLLYHGSNVGVRNEIENLGWLGIRIGYARNLIDLNKYPVVCYVGSKSTSLERAKSIPQRNCPEE